MPGVDPTTAELMARQQKRFKEKQKKEAEVELERKRLSADKLRLSYLKRTGRKEMKP